MFQSYRTIIKDATQSEVEITKKYNQQKEQIALEVKEALETESKKITQGDLLKSYNPVEISNQITTLQHKHQNCITEENIELNKIHEETDNKLFNEMKYKIKLPVTEIYKDIYCSDNGNCWVCRVWFTLVENENLNLKPGEPFKAAWFDINPNRSQPKSDVMSYSGDSERSTTDKNELKIPEFSNQFSLINPTILFPINHWGEESNQRTWWLDWVKRNRPIPE